MTGRIVWLQPSKGYSQGMRFVLDNYLKRKAIDTSHIFHMNLHTKVKDLEIYKMSRGKWVTIFNEDMRGAGENALDAVIKTLSPKLIVVNDLASLLIITGSKTYTLNLCRGSVYMYKGVPCLVVDNLANLRGIKEGSWIFLNDLSKLKRWIDGKQKPEPKFRYSVCRTVADIIAAFDWLGKSAVVSCDIETKARFITCIGYTGLVEGKLYTYVVPFLNPTRLGNCHWGDELDEVLVWQAIRDFHLSPVIKIFQNGGYDNAYFIKYRIPAASYFIDTAHLMHSLFVEAPKKLNFLASIFIDHCQYWKDEGKGEKEDSFGKTEESLERYWRYNALDCYTTFLCAIELMRIHRELPFAQFNYKNEFSNQIGPALMMSMRGMRTNVDRQRKIAERNLTKYHKRLKDLRIMTDTPNFNPNSPDQVAQFIYDVLGAKVSKGKGKNAKLGQRSTDEKVLRQIKDNPKSLWLLPMFIEMLWECKKPMNNRSKYGPHYFDYDKKKWVGMELLNGRFMYSYSAAGTETWRYACKSHQFWMGTNAQNIPYSMREMFISDPGYVIFDADYSQSDAKFVAFESEDPKYIEVMESGKDSHSIHAAHFFKRAYEEVVAGAEANEEWCVHPITGIRQITKKVVHGSNFRMAAWTMYSTAGRPAIVAAAAALGHEKAHTWEDEKLVKLCDQLLRAYYDLYKRLPVWFDEVVRECIKNGNRVTNAFGMTRYFFGDVANDQGIQREITAFLGQSGTSGNINRGIIELYYDENLEAEGALLFLQSHDSLTLQFPIGHHNTLAKKVLTIMEKKFTIKGRSLYVATDAKIGLSWGKGMIKYKKFDHDMDSVLAHEEKIDKSYAT